jgi:hypothetical protein
MRFAFIEFAEEEAVQRVSHQQCLNRNCHRFFPEKLTAFWSRLFTVAAWLHVKAPCGTGSSQWLPGCM